MRHNLKARIPDSGALLIAAGIIALTVALITFAPGPEGWYDLWAGVASAGWFLAGVNYGQSRRRAVSPNPPPPVPNASPSDG